VGNHLAKIEFVAIEAESSREAELLAIEYHRRPVDSAANGVTNQRLKGIIIGFFVVGSAI